MLPLPTPLQPISPGTGEMTAVDRLRTLEQWLKIRSRLLEILDMIMTLQKPKYLIVAILLVLGGVAGVSELYQNRDWSKGYYGPILLILGLLWLYGAFREPSSSASER